MISDPNSNIFTKGMSQLWHTASQLWHCVTIVTRLEILVLIVVESTNFENLEELDQKINNMFERIDGGGKTRRCIPCGKITRDTCNAREHAETHIDGLNFPCQYCEKTFRLRQSLRIHKCISKWILVSGLEILTDIIFVNVF